MNEIRIRETGAVVNAQEFRAMHPETGFPEFNITLAMFDEHHADPVLAAPMPAVAEHQSALRDGVVQDALGNWVYAWRVEDWSAERIEAERIAALPKVPQQVAMWQAREILIGEGLLDDVYAYFETIADPVAKRKAISKFDTSNTVQRDDPLVRYVIPLMGKTEAEIDQMFIEAAKL